MRRPALWLIAALVAWPVAQAQVATGTASFAQIALTSVDLDPADDIVPLPLSMADLVFTFEMRKPVSGDWVTLRQQNAALPFAQTVNASEHTAVQIDNDGMGQVGITATAEGVGTRALGRFTIEENPASPMMVLPHTAVMVSFDFLLGSLGAQDPLAPYSTLFALVVLERPGFQPVIAGQNFFLGNLQGSRQYLATNDSDVAGRLVFRMAAVASAQPALVPEPATSAMWLLGLAAVAAAMRQRPRP